jgi:hypothetical protein
MDNKVDRKSPEYHLLDTYCTVIEEMVSMLTEHLDIIDDWFAHFHLANYFTYF